MADIAQRGAELKKSLAVARKRDLFFAYCPGNDPAEDVFALDRKKKPEILGRVARAEGTGTKLGLGTAKVKGKVITLTCTKELPQMAKKLKKFLKFEKFPLNVIVLDANGNVLEEDVEDLGPEDDVEDVDVADDEEDNGDAAEAPEDAAEEDAGNEDAADDAGRAKALKDRAAQVQVGIKAAPQEAQAPLVKAFKGAVTALQGGELDTCDALLGKLEAALAKLGGAGDAKAAAASEPDPALARLEQVSQALMTRINALGEADGVARLRAAHGMLDEQIASGDAKKAAGTAKALGDAIAKLADQAAAQDAPAADADNAAAQPADLGAEFRDARADIEPVVLDLLQRNLGDVGKMRAVLAYFTEKGEAGDFAGAMKAVPGLNKLIADARAAEQTAAEQDIPSGVVPFVRARLEWVKTRMSLKSEMAKLQDAILSVCQGDEFPTIQADAQTLFDYLERLDNRLEDALEALVQEPDGAVREQMKADVRKVLNEYQSELDTPFFQAVDGNNGFKPVNVRGAAIASLANVNAALSENAA